MATEKTCGDCKVTKPIEEFYKHKKDRNTIGAWRANCKPCHIAHMHAYAKAHPDLRAAINKRALRKVGKEKMSWYRRRAYWTKHRADSPRATTVDTTTFRNPQPPLTKARKSLAYHKYKLRYGYGMTVAEYDALLASQGNRCAICRATKAGGRGRFHVDHCHETGRNRGLLCHLCNVALGNARDDVRILFAMIEYLGKHQAKPPAALTEPVWLGEPQPCAS